MHCFRLTSDDDFWVDVNLIGFGNRWMAVATISGDLEIGLGFSRMAAVLSALRVLGPKAAQRLTASEVEKLSRDVDDRE